MGTITYGYGARPGAAKDVVGPSAAPTDGDICAFDGVTGKLIKVAAVTGTGSLVRATSPTLVTPALGAATATSIVAGTLAATTSSSVAAVAHSNGIMFATATAAVTAPGSVRAIVGACNPNTGAYSSGTLTGIRGIVTCGT